MSWIDPQKLKAAIEEELDILDFERKKIYVLTVHDYDVVDAWSRKRLEAEYDRGQEEDAFWPHLTSEDYEALDQIEGIEMGLSRALQLIDAQITADEKRRREASEFAAKYGAWAAKERS